MTNPQSNSDIRAAITKLLHQKGAKEQLAMGTWDKNPPTDKEAMKQLDKVDKWFIKELEALLNTQLAAERAAILAALKDNAQMMYLPNDDNTKHDVVTIDTLTNLIRSRDK